MKTLKLALIPTDQYSDYRYNVIFKAYKWDPQVGDHNTVSKYVILMDQATANQLDEWAEKLSEETMLMEEALITKKFLSNKLGFPRAIKRNLKLLSNYSRQHNIRLMRFDFHPTNSGWAISEVNSDVPGGIAEASILPEIASKYFKEYQPHLNVAQSLFDAFKEKIKGDDLVAFIHATSYSDDRQVMEYISDYFKERSFKTIMCAPDHLKWINNEAYLVNTNYKIAAIMRFFPLEWLVNLPHSTKWPTYYNGKMISCNHPIAIFAQSKRLPLIWDQLGIDLPTWKQLLPTTVDPKSINKKSEEWIYKPALGRVGEGISIKEAITAKEMKMIKKAVRKHPADWIVQEKFKSEPLITIDGELYHLCIGVFTVNGKRAGFYGRISSYARIDANAIDIPILVLKEGNKDEK